MTNWQQHAIRVEQQLRAETPSGRSVSQSIRSIEAAERAVKEAVEYLEYVVHDERAYWELDNYDDDRRTDGRRG